MGSSCCSILNDTEYDVWINHGINWTVLLALVGGVLALLTAGIGLAALGASAGVGGVLAGGGALIITEEGIIMGTTAATLAGLTATQWTVAGIVTSLSATTLATALNISAQEAARIQKYVREFQEAAELIKPGKKYTWSGTLCLTMTVYVMNDKLQIGDKDCFTGATDNSEKVYTISQDFTTLDVKKTTENTVTVYSKSGVQP